MRRAVLVLVLAAACGAGTSTLDPPKASSIESVPLPQAAVEERSLAGERNVAYRVPGVTFQELSAWYDHQLPSGQAFGQWAWCDGHTSAVSHGRIYYRPGSTRILLVTVAGGDAPGVLVAFDDSGPC